MDLTTLARVKAYMGSTTTAQDAVISQLITRASGQISKFCTRNFARQVRVGDRFDGTGTDRQMLPASPIISVQAVSVDNALIPESADALAAGWQHDDTTLFLFGGYYFRAGRRNVLVSYTAGYAASESALIPVAPGPYTITPTTGGDDDGAVLASADVGVVFDATGAALTKVVGTPVAGQYTFSGGTYTFAAADAGKSVTMSYDYVPGAVEQACIELVAMKIKMRDNIGISSKTLANESVSYSDRDMSKSVRGMLDPYNRRAPV